MLLTFLTWVRSATGKRLLVMLLLVIIALVPGRILALSTQEQAIREITTKIEAIQQEINILRAQEQESMWTEFTQLLKLSSRGNEVIHLQGVLGVSKTGIFDADTKNSVIQFQIKYALVPDGIVGEKTRAVLNDVFPLTGVTPVNVLAPRLSVSLASSAVSGTSPGFIISSGNANTAGSQALAPALRLNFEVGKGMVAKVFSLTLRDKGNGADNILDAAYLYESDGITRIAETASPHLGVVSFSRADQLPLFTVEGTKTIVVLVDASKQARWGDTLLLTLEAPSDIRSDVKLVEGTFPLENQPIKVVTASDLGRLSITVKNTATLASTGGECAALKHKYF